MHPGGPVALLLSCALLSGCGRGWHYTYTDRANREYYVPEGESQVIRVGQGFEASLTPGSDLEVRITQRELCRQGVIGNVLVKHQWYRERDYGWSNGMFVAALLTTPLVPISAYLWYRWVHNRRITDRTVVDTALYEQRSVWVSDLEPCPATPPLPAAQRLARLQLWFAAPNSGYYYDVVTDDDGRHVVRGALSVASRVATFCGEGTVFVDDLTGDPAYVARNDQPPMTTWVRTEVQSAYDTGTPDAPKRIAFHAATPVSPVPADGVRSFDGLGGAELALAQQCAQQFGGP
jgi:hypothetical protein